MRNLLDLERGVLEQSSSLQSGLNLDVLSEFQTQLMTHNTSRFNVSLDMSKVVVKSFKYFKTDECKNILNEEGIVWTTEEFAQKIFGWKKSFFYKMVKLGGTSGHKINKYKREVTRLETDGETPKKSMEDCLKFVKQLDNPTNESVASNNPSNQRELVCSGKIKIEGVNKSVSFYTNNTIKSDITDTELRLLIEKLTELIDRV